MGSGAVKSALCCNLSAYIPLVWKHSWPTLVEIRLITSLQTWLPNFHLGLSWKLVAEQWVAVGRQCTTFSTHYFAHTNAKRNGRDIQHSQQLTKYYLILSATCVAIPDSPITIYTYSKRHNFYSKSNCASYLKILEVYLNTYQFPTKDILQSPPS